MREGEIFIGHQPCFNQFTIMVEGRPIDPCLSATGAVLIAKDIADEQGLVIRIGKFAQEKLDQERAELLALLESFK